MDKVYPQFYIWHNTSENVFQAAVKRKLGINMGEESVLSSRCLTARSDQTGEMGRTKIRLPKGLFRPKQKKGGNGFEESYKEEYEECSLRSGYYYL